MVIESSFEKKPDLEIYSLGQFLIKYNGRLTKREDWSSDKALKLFIYFLLNRNKEIYNEELVELFWPEIDPETGIKRLYNTIYLLRKNIGLKDILINKTKSYKFNNKYSLWIDWEEFDNLYNKCQSNNSIDTLKNAVDLYQGDLLPGLRYEYWVEDVRTNLREKYLDIIYKLSEELYKKDEFNEALKYLKKVLNKELYREEYYELTMNILARTGKIYDAIQMYERYESIVKKELGIEPGKNIQKTFNKIKNSEIIHNHIIEQENTKGALKCDLEVFNKIYELESRQITRTNEIFTLLEMDFEEINLSGYDFGEICNNLGDLFRSGDVICCYNKKIFVILHDTNLVKMNYIIQRIFKYLSGFNINKKPKFDFKEITGK
ncbi:MAG: BTAD domain-containing putative transcriptional regulator [Halanaerobiales bacterium]|nr:BTAD domain-containing putative transcriptional regulator [Halanaerobiales bacterium]